MGNAIFLLLAHAGERARVVADLALLGGAVAETMRHTPPVALVPRIAVEPLTLGGRRIARGATVQLSVAAAHRDPARFPEPDRFDVARTRGGALGFGHGVHSCPAPGWRGVRRRSRSARSCAGLRAWR